MQSIKVALLAGVLAVGSAQFCLDPANDNVCDIVQRASQSDCTTFSQAWSAVSSAAVRYEWLAPAPSSGDDDRRRLLDDDNYPGSCLLQIGESCSSVYTAYLGAGLTPISSTSGSLYPACSQDLHSNIESVVGNFPPAPPSGGNQAPAPPASDAQPINDDAPGYDSDGCDTDDDTPNVVICGDDLKVPTGASGSSQVTQNGSGSVDTSVLTSFVRQDD